SMSDRTSAGFTCSSRNARAEFFSSCWSELNEKSTAASLPRDAVGADFLGKPEHALTDDVLLHFGRPRVDRAGPRPQKRRRERAGLTRRRVDLFEVLAGDHLLSPRAQDFEGGLVEALLELGVRELRDRGRGAGRLALVERREHAQA